MAKWNTVLFDLDGTLTDPAEGIVNALVYALEKLGVEAINRQELLRFIGPPLADSFSEIYGFDEEKTEITIKYYREYFASKGIFENQIYEGIPELLTTLKAHGYNVIMATSKPEKFALEIAKHFKISGDFDFIAGATLDERRNKKSDVIAYALKTCHISADQAVMVGDRKFDIAGAKLNGLEAIGVLYGYGNVSELKEAGAVKIVASVAELSNYLLN